MNNEHEIWGFLYKELGKLKVILDCYEKFIEKIEIKNNRYNAIFQLINDAFTTYTFITLTKFFDNRKDSWSLYKFTLLPKTGIDEIKTKSSEFISFRHNRSAHFSKNIRHNNNFIFLTTTGVAKIRDIIKDLDCLMVQINVKYKYNEGYVLDWIGVDSSIENMLDDLEKYDHMKEFEERYK